MPEYPEVKVYTRNLDTLLRGRTVTESVGTPFDCVGKTVGRVVSHGKRIRFEFEDGAGLTVHLMLTGMFRYVSSAEAAERPSVMRLGFGEKSLLVTDANGYARVTGEPLDTSTPEPVADRLTLDYFRSLLKSRKGIKAILADQKLISGIGNAYADEILYKAGVHPASIANRLPSEKIDELFRATLDVIAFAVEAFDTDDPGSISGEQRDWLCVHVRGKRTTERGETIETVDINGRKSYVASSQTLYA